MNITFLKNKAECLTSTFVDNDDIPSSDEIKDSSFSKNGVFLFIAKGLICMGLLFVFSLILTIPDLPSWAIALIWVVLAVFISLGVAYASVIRKTHRQVKYQPGGRLDGINGGRKGCLLIAFVVGAFLAMSLILEIPKWDYFEWALAIISIPLFLGVAFIVQRLVNANYKPPFRTWGIICWSSVITALILCVIYVIALFTMPESTYNSALQAFMHTEAIAPYTKSNSVLMSSMGQLAALSDSFTQYAITELSAENLWIGIIWRLILGASTFFALANLLCVCWMKLVEIKRIFQPLEDLTVHENQAKKPIVYCNVAVVLLLAILFGGFFCFADYQAADIANSRAASWTRSFIQKQLAESVCTIGDKYYDRQIVSEAIAQSANEAQKLNSQAKGVLVPLIDESFNKRQDNIDSYLKWFYSPEGISSQLASKTPLLDDSYPKLMFTDYIESGVNDSKLHEEIMYYSRQAEAIQPQLMAQLQDMELENTSEWMLDSASPIGEDELNTPAKIVQGLVTAGDKVRTIPATEAFSLPDPPLFLQGDYKVKIEDAINAERDRYLSIVGGR